MSLSDCYGTLVTPFGELGPMYDALGHRGADYDADAGGPILAYDDMVVEYVGRTNGLGGVVGARRINLGGFAGFAHQFGALPVGSRISKGGVLAYVAGAGNSPGELWTGPHIHTTESDVSAYAAAVGIRPLTDPAPAIAGAVSSSAAGLDATTITPPLQEEEMKLFWVGNSAYLQTAFGTSEALTPITYRLFYRLINSNQHNDPQGNGVPQERFTDAEKRAVDEVLRSIARKVLTNA